METVILRGKKAAGRVIRVSDADYELVARYPWHVHESIRPSGVRAGPYARTHIRLSDGSVMCIYMHRLLLPGVPEVDHADGDGLNNQRYNLRAAGSHGHNMANTGKRGQRRDRPPTSQYKGVSRHRASGLWVAQIVVGGDRKVRYFADEVEAALAYDAAAREAWGKFARLNFP